MNEKDNVKRVFSKNKHAYVTSSTHAYGDDLLKMESWLNPDPTMAVLDIATGGGHAAKRLAPSVREVFATDITKAMLENTRQHLQAYANIKYVIADAENLPFLDLTFDMVTCRIAAHHFPHPEQFIQEVNRVLKPNGKFLFIDNTVPEVPRYASFLNRLEKMRDYSHVRCLSVNEWNHLFKENHLTVIQQEYRKKKLNYTHWINRTLHQFPAKEKVHQYMLKADQEIQSYFEFKQANGKIQQFTIDEWMVVAQKLL
ncbi:class I SAM-dependent methyltransferase [Virgibacillus salexigens]|uniref:SAM-dependent methyltransferase n=1 Tax=Virgibacillus kapii TaxID=1638645 RepID=A0ABQ2D2P9_9BACI|nr:class I SAM-dependent methyltransferase [Virgibacillus kapii]GGJ43595.1 SAM-dependent methyltransferase [Virgibacillus kapii]